MRKLLQLATLLFLTGTPCAHAQITNPDNLVAPPPRPPQMRAPAPEDDLQWVWSYTRDADSQSALGLRDDIRFKEMLRRNFNAPQAFWGESRSLADTIPLFLTRYGHIETADNRYVSIDGCVPRFCPAHGMLWMDLGTPHPLIVFVGVNWSAAGHTVDQTSSSYDLWAFSNRPLTPATVPEALVRSIAKWDKNLQTNGRIVPHIGHAILVDQAGMPTFILPELLGANRLPPQAAVSPADGSTDEPNP